MNDSMNNVGVSINQTMKHMNKESNQTLKEMGQSTNQTGEAVQQMLVILEPILVKEQKNLKLISHKK